LRGEDGMERRERKGKERKEKRGGEESGCD